MTIRSQELVRQCVDCSETFDFSIPEQRFYAERGLNEPCRCPDCRARRRAERNSDAMKSSDGASGPLVWSDGFGNYGGAANGNSRRPARGVTRMYATVCTGCGKSTDVPFEPRGGRPVYCRECFNARRGR
jgi:CxxC-x17-CxxC domain-containing protein